MQHFIARESSSGRLFHVVAKDSEDAYHVFGREVCGMVEPIDTGNVDIDLFPIPDLSAAGVVPIPYS